MDIAIAGGHGKIALLLGETLAERGDSVRGLVRGEGQVGDLREVGVDPVLCDLESDHDVATAIEGADAVVFAAGAGPGSGAERKRTVDFGGAVKLIEAARANGVDRYVMVSAMGAANPPAEGGEVYGEYLRAKAAADRALLDSNLDYTIVRPGRLTDEPPSGHVRVGSGLDRGEIPRADVAATLALVLRTPGTVGRAFDLLSGEAEIEAALAGL